MNRRYFLIAAAGLVAVFFLRSRPGVVEIGKTAPSFQLPSLNGPLVSLNSYRGKTVLLNFWASWCPECRDEFPALDAVYKKRHADGFELLAASVDNDGRKAVMPFVAKTNPTFPILLADPKTAEAYGVRALPVSYLIGVDGTVVKRYLGAVDPAELENDILSQLPRRPS